MPRGILTYLYAVTKIFMGLKANGFNVRTGIFTVDGGKRELMKLLKKGGDFTD